MNRRSFCSATIAAIAATVAAPALPAIPTSKRRGTIQFVIDTDGGGFALGEWVVGESQATDLHTGQSVEVPEWVRAIAINEPKRIWYGPRGLA